ncbi:putative carbamoyl transferase, NodU family [alpha proteobacterium HIMB114]|nr:putative carbamoyl transferase, NodU family [alpha proteobacterium HIMB114]
MTYILGISAFYHDSSASLIKDGKIISAVQEERFTRVKHDSSFPKESIKYILENSDIKLSEINSIVFYEKPFLKFERLLETYIAFAPKGFRSFAASMPIWLREKLFQKDMIFKELRNIDQSFDDIKKLKFSEHHMSHAASAYYPSPYDEALVLTLDGVGEWSTTTIGIGKKNKIEILKEIHFPHSLGLLYSAFTYYLGFKVNSGEYKVMGLAPYGTPKYKNIILDNLIIVQEDGSFKMNMKYFDFATDLKMTNKKFGDLFGQKRRNPEVDLLTEFHMDIASSLQAVTEEIVLKITTKIKEEYKIDNLCMSGGVALNCVANGKIIKNKIFENIWIQPASGDAGGSLGAALAYWHNELNNHKINSKDAMQGSYLGPSYESNYIEKELNRIGANFQKYTNDELLDVTANELANEKAIGWFQGRMEFGPRSLGARSIIADPRSDKMQKNLNLKVKFRESFRPFAPAVLREKVNDYFNIDQDSPYMLLVSDVNENIKIKMSEEDKKLFGIEKLNIKRSSIPAVTHVDYSARIQTVHQETNKKFYDLIKKFFEKTNCAVLINTSFNVRGEPIVNTPEDAFRCFMGTNLDLLVIEDFVLFKDKQNKDLLLDYKNKFELD